MGAGGSTNSSNNPAPVASTNSPPNLPVSDDPSLSVASVTSGSVDEPASVSHITEVEITASELGVSDVPGTATVVTLWKPEESEDLFREDVDNGLYIEGSATVNLAPNPKKKRCSCFCCRKRRRRRRRSSSSEPMGSLTDARAGSSDNLDDDYSEAEIITLQSQDEEVVVIPADAFPLEMITTADFPIPVDMRPSEVAVQKAKSKKIRRAAVPEKPDKPMGLWGLIKSAIGKDITRFPLPVNFAEPLSMLQRLAEDYEYSSILDKASRTTDSLEQLAYIAAFTISSYASTAVRTAKPFNPLLGETYEFDRTGDLGWRCLAEQVCHHPPIAALHCESSGWVHWQQFTMKSNFRGTYLEINPLGVAHLRFKTSENHYTWHKVSTLIRNLYIGKLYIEQQGEMDITNHTTNEWCHLKFTCGGMFSRDKSVTGKIYNKASEAKWDINGTWDKEVSATKLDEKGKPISGETRVMWQTAPLPSDAEKHYCFSHFACQLNDMEDGIAPTDSRNRTDQRLMENGQWDEANIEKQRLEDKQRETRKNRAMDGTNKHSTASHLNTAKPHTNSNGRIVPVSGPEDGVEPFYSPAWFNRQRDPLSGQYIYMFSGEYWNCKEKQDWERCPSLYDK